MLWKFGSASPSGKTRRPAAASQLVSNDSVSKATAS